MLLLYLKVKVMKMVDCKDCIHDDVCDQASLGIWERLQGNDECSYFMDKAKFIEVPCKIGDTVYEINLNTYACEDCNGLFANDYDNYTHCKVHDEAYPQMTERPVCEKHFWEIINHLATLPWIFKHYNDFGKTVFLTKEEAEQALKEGAVNG